MPNSEWDVEESRIERSIIISPEEFYISRFVLRMRRRLSFLTFALTVPCLLMTLLTTLMFVVPPQSGKKLSIGRIISQLKGTPWDETFSILSIFKI